MNRVSLRAVAPGSRNR